MSDEFAEMDAVAQADLVRRGEVAAIELVDAAIARIEKLNPELNAVVTPLFDEARAAALSPDLPDGPFRGVPFLIKDIGAYMKGMPQYQGNRVLREIDWRAPADTALGARFRRAGFVVLGKTNTPEFGVQPTTQPVAFGPARNPYDLSRSTSGSSGGSAAAVASGMVAAAHANDGGGSIRMPASWCGVVGLKPSRGRTSRGPLIGRLGVEHAVCRSVRDTAAILDAVCGPEPGDLYLARPPTRPYKEEVRTDPGRLRIGILTKVDASGVEIHPDCVRAAEEAAALLESLGHVVEDLYPERLFDDEFLEQAEIDYACMMKATLETLWRSIGRTLSPNEVEPYSWARMERVASVSATEHIRSMTWLQRYAIRICRWWAGGHDLLVTPTCGEPPARLEELIPPAEDPWSIDHGRFSRIRCFARPFNVTGQPAISLPLRWTDDGLPIGVQLVADLGQEDALIRVAAQLEEAAQWRDRRPPLFAG